jgi:hypothetical protein
MVEMPHSTGMSEAARTQVKLGKMTMGRGSFRRHAESSGRAAVKLLRAAAR